MTDRDDATPRPSTARLWIFRIVAVVGIPVFLLVGAELVLRAAGVGHDTSFLQRVTIDGRAHWRDNPWFHALYFPETLLPRQLPVVVPVEKGPREIRVALLGGSAAQGIPEPAYGMAVFLEEQLRHRHPAREVRVLNLANTAINSHVVAEIARQIEPLEVDAIVVYLGNNEVVGPFGAGTMLTQEAPPAAMIRLTTWLRGTRLGQVLMRPGGRDVPRSWRGMEMFVDHRVGPDDPALDRVREHFGRNLRAIADVARRLDVPMVLSTVSVNLRHCAPFGGASLQAVAPSAAAERDRAIAAADSAMAEGDARRAFHALDHARSLDPESADIMYRIGRLRLAAGDTTDTTRSDFLNALDHDTLRFRADLEINRIVREVAAEREGITLADVEGAIASVSPGRLPGREVFFEHVHFDVYGNQVVSRVLADAVERAPGSPLARPENDGWLDSATIGGRAGYTVVERQRVLGEVTRLLTRPPFTNQLDQTEQLQRLATDLRAAAAQVPRDDLLSLWPQYEAAMEARPWDWLVRFRAATFLSDLADAPERGEALWRGLVDDLPHYPGAWFGLGRSLAAQGRPEAAMPRFERALELYAHQPAVAVAWADAARAASPNDPEVRRRALEREARALRIEGSDGALERLRLRYAEDALWWQERGDVERARRLRERAEAIAPLNGPR